MHGLGIAKIALSALVILNLLWLVSSASSGESERKIDASSGSKARRVGGGGRAEELLAQLTLEEKMSLMHGHKGVYVGNINEISRLGIPAIKMQDGPQGFRTTKTTGPPGTTTAWPSALTIASSFDTDLIYRWGAAMASEFKDKGANVFLGPGVGIARVPQAGRNFEYLCGEDPLLGAKAARAVIRGIQAEKGLIATVKHWINNEQEVDRKTVSSFVDERTRFELYYPPFEAAVEEGVLALMCAYNQINGVSACENSETLGDLRNHLGYDGWVMSDWIATYSTVPSLTAGLDTEMPVGLFYSESKLESALEKSEITSEEIDKAVLRLLTAMETSGLLDAESAGGDPHANVTTPEHQALSREIAAKSAILLKNEGGILPLNFESTASSYRIAVIGDQDTVSGGGSGHVTPAYVVTPYQGIVNAINDLGLNGVSVQFNDGKNLTSAVELAKESDLVVITVACSSSEGSDRASLSLGDESNTLVSSVAGANSRTIVTVNSPGAVLLPFSEDSGVKAIIMSMMPGQEAGNALADVLFGKVNPSGRLPVTIPNYDNEVQFTETQYPGVGIPKNATYLEQLLIGYRWYDAKNIGPKYPFGFGLSYTQFSYSDLFIQKSMGRDAVVATFTLANVGNIDGSEVPQLYLQFPESAGEPLRQLKDFSKVAVSAGSSVNVNLSLSSRDFSFWDQDNHAWQIVSGEFLILIGSSSRQLHLSSYYTV